MTTRAAARPAAPARTIVYRAPQRDFQFLFNDVLKIPPQWAKLAELTKDDGLQEASGVFGPLLENAAKFAENVVFPVYTTSDGHVNGARYNPATKSVTTSKGWKKAAEEYLAAGWGSVSAPTEFGGQGLPESLSLMKNALIGEANWPWSMFTLLSGGCFHTILSGGDKEMHQTYLPKLATSEWYGTMCLSEANAGSDLGQSKAMATKYPDGPKDPGPNAKTYRVSGTKIWISGGDHDLAENVIHIVLARTPDAPPGTRGLSLFLVPKYLMSEMSKPLAQRKRNVVVSRIEEKIGIHGSPTCVLEFEAEDGKPSVGWLIGEENKGLQNMFVFMNVARLGVAIQGFAAAELAAQNSYKYAIERKAGQHPDGPREKGIADAIVHHPDVRRMLLFQRAIADGGRWLVFRCAKGEDAIHSFHKIPKDNKAALDEGQKLRQAAQQINAFLTPIAKGFLTEMGIEAANFGIQVHGGNGYVEEYGMSQIMRDARIGTIYEGTTGIQAQDLIGRKMLADKLQAFMAWKAGVAAVAQEARAAAGTSADLAWLADAAKALETRVEAVTKAALALGKGYATRKSVIFSAATDMLYAMGFVVLGEGWLSMATIAAKKLAAGGFPADSDDATFLRGKIITGKFYLNRVLPRADAHIAILGADDSTLVEVDHKYLDAV